MRISIITVSYNSEDTIERTINSVLNQNCDIEYIVVDGDSTDNTREIINRYSDDIDKLIIEKDDGLWDAMNKGIKASTGEVIGIINSDDYYYPNKLRMVSDEFQCHNIDFMFAPIRKNGRIINKYKKHKILYSFNFYTSHSAGFFVKKYVHDKIGLYKNEYFSADYDLLLRMYMNGFQGKILDTNEPIGYFESGGISSKRSMLEKINEHALIRRNNNINKIWVLIIYILQYIKHYRYI